MSMFWVTWVSPGGSGACSAFGLAKRLMRVGCVGHYTPFLAFLRLADSCCRVMAKKHLPLWQVLSHGALPVVRSKIYW